MILLVMMVMFIIIITIVMIRMLITLIKVAKLLEEGRLREGVVLVNYRFLAISSVLWQDNCDGTAIMAVG